MNEKTLRVLEYHKVVEKLEEKAESKLGKEMAKDIKPSTNIDEVEQVFDSLVDNGEIVKLKEDLFIHKDMFLKSIEKAKLFAKSNGYITVSDFRDILNTNRKMSMALLEYFDQRKITKRIEDRRVFY